MRTTSSICFYCRKSKADKKGFSPIEVSITINGKRAIFNLPRKERPRDFEKMIKKSDLFDYLESVRTNINIAQTELLRNGIAVTSARLKEYIKTGGIKSYTLSDLVGEFNTYLKGTSVSPETYKKYQIVFERFLDFAGKETEINSITNTVISSFYSILNKENVEATTGGKMTKIKTLFRYAFDNGKISHFPFNGIKINKGKPKKEYLCEGDVRKMMEKKIDIERLEKVRDILIFQMSTGLSYTDIWDVKNILEKDGIHYIKGRRRKTGIEFTAVVLPEGLSIWEKYNGVLPVISNQKLNAYAKELQDICGITQNLTSHLFRKTYATSMLNRGVAITTVSKMLGHSNSNITQRHYASVYDDTVINEVKAVI